MNMRFCHTYVVMMLCLFMGMNLGWAQTITPQQLDVLKAKESHFASVIESQQRNVYTMLPFEFHTQVQKTFHQLLPAQQETLRQLEEHLPASAKYVKETTLDDRQRQEKDMNLLWQAAVYRSQPIRYAIEKLSRQDASGKAVKKPNFLKKVGKGAAQAGGIAATVVTGNPLGMISGSVVNDLLSPAPGSIQKTVTDADMVILARAVDTLQTELLHLYLGYRQCEQAVVLQKTTVQALEADYSKAFSRMGTSTAQDQQATLLRFVMDAARQELVKAQGSYDQARHSLGLKVGSEALALLELNK